MGNQHSRNWISREFDFGSKSHRILMVRPPIANINKMKR
jgi:hypothetical protein